MATDKQILANRANAKLSTGPKTEAGRIKSSRNSYRHGLSSPFTPVSLTQAAIDVFTRSLVSDKASEDQLACATAYARSQIELQQIRSARVDLTQKVDITNTEDLRRIAALDRYERVCLTKSRRAAQGLDFVRASDVGEKGES